MSTATSKIERPSKKQQQLLEFIGSFIAEKGYGPSYREIMSGCNYTSVATVAVHVNNLIKKGHLTKKDRSARSLEVVNKEVQKPKIQTNSIPESEEKWLIELIDYRFKAAEDASPDKTEVDNLYVLIGALKVLGLHGAASSFMPRLSDLKSRL
jgi:SOS-response transcriptional repressor LexA